ncbi:uncharacterized protein LOC124657308 [Lolium rigidum]|uniref:uncharacterized protein LOC124657308 n=1 Tax=Lolium rigidum TaxID=89674 RepID=UPI001F5DA908|nr:uncharacterized protein LOC124657308 [Lolium rigidum]
MRRCRLRCMSAARVAVDPIDAQRPFTPVADALGNMPQTKRAGDADLTESSKKNRGIDTSSGKTLDLIIAGDLNQDINSEELIDKFRDCDQSVWSELSKEVTSKFSRSVVSLALSDGHKVLFACSGIALQRQPLGTRFLTSSSLVRAYNDKKAEGCGSLKIEVRRNGNVATGLLGDYDFDQKIALVNIAIYSLGVRPLDLDHQVEFLPCSKVVAVARADSGTLMATTGILTGDSSGSEDGKQCMLSTCKISEAWEGGPLFDCDGNFVGMNLCLVGEGTSFVSRSIIIKRLEKYMPKKKVKRVRHVKIQRQVQPLPYCTYPRDRSGELDCLSYPKPSAATEGLKLVNIFEETFGDLYGSSKGVWSQLGKTVSQNLSRVVVSLASFSGERRFFACSGLVIEWNGCTIILTSASLVRDPNDENKIAENLKIVVLLPNKQRKEGILQHSSLHHNVALVGVKDFRPLRSFSLEDRWNNKTRKDPKRTRKDPNVVAVGRCFKSGVLMATCGRGTDWSGMLDYRGLRYSSCKITKAGIGGPLVDFSGRFIGMNFYDKKIGTPFMSRDCITRVLAHFEGKSPVDEVTGDGKTMSSVDKVTVDDTPVSTVDEVCSTVDEVCGNGKPVSTVDEVCGDGKPVSTVDKVRADHRPIR